MAKRYSPIIPICLIGSSMLISTGITHAQDDNALTEEVLVTGSRILRNPLAESAPMTNLSNEDLEVSGLTNFGDMLQQLPVTGSAINTRFNVPGNDGFPQDGTGIGAGAAQVSLRNLGAKRTLVLIDGRRWISGASASGVPVAVDLNTIPANVIKRVEILQDGASAIYGSDAIGGVVNVITNSDFEGFKIDAQRGQFISDGDGQNLEVSALFGAGNDNTHIVFSASRVEERGVFTSDRAQSAYPTPFATSCSQGGCSSFTPQGRFILGSAFDYPQLVENDQGELVEQITAVDMTLETGVINDGMTNIPVFNLDDRFNETNRYGDDWHPFTASDRFNFNGNGFNYLKTPNERYNLFTSVTHEFNDDLRFIAKASYTSRNSATRAAPEPLCLGEGCGNPILYSVVIHADQIYNPFGVNLSVEEGTMRFFGRRPLESGPRIFQQNVNTYYVSGGFEGSFNLNDNEYYWDVTTSYGDNRGVQQKFNSHNAARLSVALGDPAVCNLTPGCVPFNFFGGQGANGEGSITQEMLDFVTYTQRDLSQQTLFDVAGNITGSLASLPAGNLAFAAGFEYREHDGSFEPDPVAARAETAGIPSGATAGAFDVTEFYGEINIPLLAGVAGAEYLELNGAIRTSDYSTIGSESTYKVSTLYRPLEDLSFRASISTGIRAPGIGELFGGATRADFTYLDACADVLGTQGAANGGRDEENPQPNNIVANCATLGIPVDLTQTNPQVSARNFGNPDLIAETSENASIGFVYSPSWTELEKLTFSFDYYSIEIDDAIQGLDPGSVVDYCVETLDANYCDRIERGPSGGIDVIQNQINNIGGIEASGYDLALDLATSELGFGKISGSVKATLLSEYIETTQIDPEGIDYAGTITNETFQRAFPDWRMTTRVGWEYGAFMSSLTFRSVSSMTQASGNELESKTFTDVQVSYRGGEDRDTYALTLGFNNIFDNDPATCDSCGVIGMSPVIHDIPGVVGYLKLSVKLD